MAKLFEINIPSGTSTLQLDSQRRGTIHYTVKNVSARAIDGRAVLVPVPQTPADPNHPVQKGWVKLDGKADRHFEINGEDTYTVNVAVPPKTPEGTYSFRLDVNWVAKPDEGDSSQAVKFAIPKTEVKPVKWGLIAVIAVIVLCVIGGLTWFLLRPKKATGVPDLTGMTVPDATTALTAVNLHMDSNIVSVVGKPEDADKVVEQNPVAGAPPPAGGNVQVKVGAEMVTVPELIGHSMADAQTILGKSLAIGQTSSQPNPNFAGGIIFQQTPGANTSVPSTSTVNVVVTPQTVPVPHLVGLPLSAAIAAIQNAGLVLGSLSGDQTGQAVVSASPPENTPVVVGSKVNLQVPITSNCIVARTCVYFNGTGRFLVQPQPFNRMLPR